MKYIIELREDNTILRVAKIRPKTEVLSNKGRKTTYDLPINSKEIDLDQYNILINTNQLTYSKYINGELIHEPEIEKEARLVIQKERQKKRIEDKKVKEIKYMLSMLGGYVKLTPKGKELLNE